MSINKVWIEEGCTGCQACEAICPEVFDVSSGSAVVKKTNLSLLENKIKEAATSCPVEVIKYS